MPRHHEMDDLEFEEDLGPSSRCCSKRCLRQNLLVIFIIISVFVGVGLGIGLRELNPPLTSREIMYVEFVGEIFLRMLKVLILPLIVSSLITGLSSLDTSMSGKIGLRAVIYYLLTTVFAVILGIVLVVSIHPGRVGTTSNPTPDSRPITVVDPLLDLVRNMFPDNIIGACFQQVKTVLSPPDKVIPTGPTSNETAFNFTTSIPLTTTFLENFTAASNGTNETSVKENYYLWKIGKEMTSGINVMGLVVFSIAVGIALGRLGNAGRALAEVFSSLNEVVMILVDVVMKFSPVGILFLIAAKVLEMKDPVQVMQQLGMYTVTVITGLVIHGFIVLPLIFFIFTRRNPFSYIMGVLQALMTAIGTSSSSATLPVSIKCLEENNRIDSRISRFVLPIGATINMDGTALYEAVAAIFIAQSKGIYLDAGKIAAVSITATAASIGAAGVPQAGLVTMVMVLDAVGLPSGDVVLILSVDWLLDRIRTMINVLGDCIGAGIVQHLSRSFLRESSMDSLTEVQTDARKQNGAPYLFTPSELQGTANAAFVGEKGEQVTGF